MLVLAELCANIHNFMYFVKCLSREHLNIRIISHQAPPILDPALPVAFLIKHQGEGGILNFWASPHHN